MTEDWRAQCLRGKVEHIGSKRLARWYNDSEAVYMVTSVTASSACICHIIWIQQRVGPKINEQKCELDYRWEKTINHEQQKGFSCTELTHPQRQPS